MADTVFIAVDLGASSGRHVAGLFDGRRLELAEIHRFENRPVPAAGHLYWDVLNQWNHIRDGLQLAGSKHRGRIRSLGVDTWGVDFALLGRGDELLGNPVHYRDHRTDGMLEKATQIVPRSEIFAATGLQFMQINTLYQLLAMKLADSPLLEAAQSMLLMPDLFHWLLTGVKANEFTNATTTQFFDPQGGRWAAALLEKLGLPTRILGEVVQPGTRLGSLLPQVAAETGLAGGSAGVSVVLPGTHDTASAVLAVPARDRTGNKPLDWCYISSGTWSLMGVELPEPVINDQCLALNFTNEGGVGGTIRLLKNIAGLWLIQECRRVWAQQGSEHSWDELRSLAAAARPLTSIIDPDDSRLLAPADMPRTIAELCKESGQPVPESEGAIIRCAMESLAVKYRLVLERLERLAGTSIRTIHVVGGGAHQRALCQMTASACRRRVLAGPVEATAIGNLMLQAIAAGEIASIAEGREIVAASFPLDTYEPQEVEAWEAAYGQFLERYGFR